MWKIDITNLLNRINFEKISKTIFIANTSRKNFIYVVKSHTMLGLIDKREKLAVLTFVGKRKLCCNFYDQYLINHLDLKKKIRYFAL